MRKFCRSNRLLRQPGESPMSVERRIDHEARELERMGAKPETVVLIVQHRGRPAGPNRRRIARALIEQLSSIDGTLIFVADRASPKLRQDLMTLVGTLIEEDGVKHAIAIDFDATRMAELRATHAPMLSRASRTREADCAVAC